tara:strand:- start:37 stop:1875 length:1839 start_codon:yes stop_codon:yes gene_type:complete
MATYREIHGKAIKSLSTDPSDDYVAGQIWYNTSSSTFKTVVTTSAWRSSSSIIVARDAAGSAGTQTTATIFGGNINPGNTSATDEFDGNGFSVGGTLNTARRQTTGCGLQTAALCVGGYTTANSADVEEYNGTAWSEQNNIPSNYRNGSTFGTQTAALYVGGYSAPVPNATTIQIYDGTNWTTSPATLGTGGNDMSSTGTSTAGLVFGGSNRLNATEEWNGSAMSSGGNMTTSKYGRGSANQAPSENALSAGGGIPAQTTVENYDGTSWTTLPSLAVATNSIRGAGTAAAAMMMGGGPGGGPVFFTSTEFDNSATVVTSAAWSAGGNMNTARGGTNNASGDKSAAATFGGQTSGGRSNATELYDGTSWTNGTNTPATRRSYLVAGTQTAAVLTSGQPPTPTANSDAETYEFDGSSFTETNDINTQRGEVAGCGTQTAALGVGGRTRPGSSWVPMNNVEEYDGSSWTAANVLPSANASSTAAAGPQTAAIFAVSKPANYAASYDGTNWTVIPATQTIPNSYGGASTMATTSSEAYMGGGEEPGGTRFGKGQEYDGTAWATTPAFATARNSFGGTGTIPSMIIMGGQADPGYTTATEEFTVETSALNVKTLTQS